MPGATGFVPSSEQGELKQWLSQLLACAPPIPPLYQGAGQAGGRGERLWRHQADGGGAVVYLLNVSSTPQSYAVPVGKLRSASTLVDLQSGEPGHRWQQRDGGLATAERSFPAGALSEVGNKKGPVMEPFPWGSYFSMPLPSSS